MQKNLESLIARAEGMEHRLQSLMLHPGVDKREQYTAAALLLAEGQEAERSRFALTRHLFQYDGRGDRTGNGERKDLQSNLRIPLKVRSSATITTRPR